MSKIDNSSQCAPLRFGETGVNIVSPAPAGAPLLQHWRQTNGAVAHCFDRPLGAAFATGAPVVRPAEGRPCDGRA